MSGFTISPFTFNVYKSTNQGTSFSVFSGTSGTLSASGATLYVLSGTQLYVNSGQNGSFTLVSGASSIGASSIAVSSQNASILYAVTSSNGIEESTDGGNAFTPTGTLPYAGRLVIDPSNSAHLLVASTVNQAGFAAKLNSTGSQLTWSTYLGGTSSTTASGVATDGNGDAFITGYSSGGGFPVTSTVLPAGSTEGTEEAFITEISDATPALGSCPAIVVNPGSVTTTSIAQTLTFGVVAPSGCAWSASTNSGSATITSGASGTGSGVITVALSANTNPTTNSVTLTVNTTNVGINQASNSCTYQFDQASYSVRAAGGPVSAILTTPSGCPWVVTNNYGSAITVTSNGSGTGNATIGLTVNANANQSSLTFNLPVGTTQIQVVQAAAGALAPQTIMFDTIPNQIFGISPFPIAAQSSALLPVGFNSTTPAVCKNSHDLVMLLSAGTCSITAYQSGNDVYSAATDVTKSFIVSVAKISGSFMQAAGSPFAAGTSPYAAAVGDFTLDGIPDLAIANAGGNNVTVLLGNGSGGFAAAPGSPFAVGSEPESQAVGDFNGDGIPDLAVANYTGGDGTVTVLLGNGSGGFAAAPGSPFAVGINPIAVAVGDFNGDGIQDLATANSYSNNVTVLLGNGSGGFTQASGSPFAVGRGPRSVALADFNGDGIPDLATANSGDNTVTLLPGERLGWVHPSLGQPVRGRKFSLFRGGGGLQRGWHSGSCCNQYKRRHRDGAAGKRFGRIYGGSGQPVRGGNFPYSAAVGDFNGDGIPDIVTANYNGPNNVTVLLGSGSGGFAPGNSFPVGNGPFFVAVGDFNGDGIEDLATVNNDGPNVTVLLGVPGQTITFGSLNNVELGVAPFTIAATASSGLPVSFASTTTGVCTVSGSTVTVVTTGTCSITASQAGNVNNPPAPNVVQSFTVGSPATTPSVTIIALSPNSAVVGTPAFSLTISGTGFTRTSTALFNGAPIPTTFVNPGQVTAIVRAALVGAVGAATVSVGDSNALPFYVAAPTITSLNPTSTPGGNPQFTLTVNGSGFVNSVSTVYFNGTALATTFVSSSQLTAIVPANQNGFNVPVTVVNLTTSSNPLIFTLGPQQYSCAATTGTPPLLRVGSEAELLGDFVLSCTPGASSNGVVNQDVTVQPSNFNFTSRILNAATGATEALLLVGDPAPSAQVLGANVFQGLQSGANIVFPGVALDTTVATTLRIVNLRANTLPLALGTAAQTASIGVNMGSIAVTNAFQALGFAMPISFQESIPFSAGNQTSVQLNYTQNFANTFRVRVAPTGVQNVPGTVYNTESGFVNPALAPGAGLADSGTRLLLQVNGVPAGVNVYAAVSSSDGVSASLVSTDNDGVGTEGSFITGAGMFGGTFAPVSVSNGTGTAVWEVVSASAPANLSFQIVLTGMTQAGLGPVSLEGSIAPLSAATTSSATAPLPRFSINSLTGFIDLTLLSTSSSATRSTGAQALAALAANPLSVAYRGRTAAAPTADGIPVSAPSPIQAGSSVTLGFSAVNQSAGAVTQVTIQSNVPSLLSVGSCSAPGGSCSNSTNPDGSTSVTAVYPGPVQPGASTSLSYTATACTSCVQNSAATVSTTVNGLNAGQQFVSDADPDDNTSNSSVTVVGTTPQVNVQFATNPPGLTLQIPSGISPISQSGSLNFQAVTPQPGPNGSQYVFSSWSDGSTSAIRTAVPVPLGGGTFTATFIAQYPPNVIAFGSVPTQILGNPAFTLNASASSGLAVAFASNSTAICTVSGTMVTLVAAGTCSITATQPGNSFYAAAEPVTVTFTVDPVFADTAGDTAAENEALDLMATYGITSGCSTTPFDYCPNETVTRAQMAVFIIRSIFHGNNFTYTQTPYFTDVPANAQFFKYIQKMKDLGITSGETPTTYGPNDTVTRGEMAVFIIRARYGTGVPFNYTQTPYFTDVTAGAEFQYIQKMKDVGITSGETPTTYGPNDPVTRGEMAVFVMRGVCDARWL